MKTSLATSPTKAKFGPLLFTGDLEEALECAARLGYDGVELNLRDSRSIDQGRVKARLHSLGLSVPSIGTGQSYFTDGLSLADGSSDIRSKVLERMQDHIRFAADVGARVVIGSVRGRLSELSPETRRQSYGLAIEATQSLAEFAAACSVGLTVEPINRYETNFLNTIGEAIEFIDQVGAPNVGVLADTFHMNIEEASMEGALRQAGERLQHIHLVDSNRQAPGMGHLDFVPLIAILRSFGYEGWLSAEILPLPDDATAAQTWIDASRGLLKQ